MSDRIQRISTAPQLGVLLHGARKQRRLTQAQLGARLGLGQTRMSELELAPQTLSVEQLLALCQHLGLQLVLESRDGSDEDAVPQAAPATDW